MQFNIFVALELNSTYHKIHLMHLIHIYEKKKALSWHDVKIDPLYSYFDVFRLLQAPYIECIFCAFRVSFARCQFLFQDLLP